MLAQPLISVIITSYNQARFVTYTVTSVLEQTYSPLEVIVVDDGSTDETKAELAPYLDKIRYIYQLNQGVSVARNTGIKAAKGELIAFLDGDDLWLPHKLALQVECLEKSRDVGLVHSNVSYFGANDEGERQTKGALTTYAGDCYAELLLRNRITTSSVLVRRDCLKQVGLFDEGIRKASTEDYDLWIRIARYFEFAYVPDPVVLYRVHPNNAINDFRTLIENERYVLEKSIEADPRLIEKVGRRRLHQRLFDIYFSLGYGNFEQGYYDEANRWFARALKHRIDLYAAVLWAASTLPPALVKRMRNLKHVLARAH
jgi:glycosyltransferase involved in cell wall biosynthesis